MSVSNYLAKSEYGCRYHYDKLKDTVYIVPDELVRNIVIDNGEAYVSGSTGEILKLEGYKIEYKEETSLDERYRFQKTLTLGINGIPELIFYRWMNLDPNEDWWCEGGNKYYKQMMEQYVADIYGKYYIIIETTDGAYYLINPDFSSNFTYTYNLSNGINQTDFNLTGLSNFPALEVKNFNPPDYFVIFCKNYLLEGVENLRMLEYDKVVLSNSVEKVVSTEAFKTVEYLDKSFSFQESYDGNRYTTTIEFQIAFNAYKTSWHYNLLEFLQNKYAAIIKIKGVDKNIYAWSDGGFQVNYSIQASSVKGQSDIITITLTQVSNSELKIDNYAEEISASKHWRYISKIGNKKAFDCASGGVAKYLLQEECNCFGNPTGNYKVLSGYASWFPNLNITGTFSDVVTFYNPTCN